MAIPPPTRYAKAGDVNIAYQVTGEGPIDVVLVPGFIGHLDLMWEAEGQSRTFERFASFCRLIRFDKRGAGLSDPVPDAPTLEQRMDDVRAVMDAVGSERAALVGVSEGGPMSVLFAASYPERTRALVLMGSFAGLFHEEDGEEVSDEIYALLHGTASERWGDGSTVGLFFPSLQGVSEATDFFSRLERYSASPGAALRIIELLRDIDVRDVLPSIRVPTLVLHNAGDPMVKARHGRYLADHIARARYVEADVVDHLTLDPEDIDAELDEIEGFLTGSVHETEPDRILTTVLFTDIVASTERAAEVGDREWRSLLDRHDEAAATEVERFDGRLVKATGDGILARFDGPGRAVRCAWALQDRIGRLGLDIRAGLHTGEAEVRGDDLGGLAVHIGSRVEGAAEPGQIWVSRTVKDLVVGSGIGFADRGDHELKGVPETWRLYSVEQV